MATQPTQGSAIAAFPATPPMPAVARILARFERDQLAGFIAVALDLIDTLDGDPDMENATDLEDDHALSPQARGYDTGPGCEVADTGEHVGDEQDSGWTEHHTRGRHKLALGMSEPFADHEDDEDDDPDTSVEDGSKGFDPEEDFGGEEAGEPEDYSIEAFSDPDALRENRARIRRTRCDRIEYVSPWSHSPRVEFRLKDPPSLNC